MELFNGATIFWLITIGSTTGWLLSYSIGHEGISLWGNIIWGICGALCGGFIAVAVGLPDILVYGLLGTFAMLFLANVFHMHHVEDIQGDIDRGLRIKRK